MPMKDEPKGEDLNGDGKKGHGKVPAFLKQEEAEQVDEASMIGDPAAEEEEVAESVDELKEWYLGTLSEALVKKFTK